MILTILDTPPLRPQLDIRNRIISRRSTQRPRGRVPTADTRSVFNRTDQELGVFDSRPGSAGRVCQSGRFSAFFRPASKSPHPRSIGADQAFHLEGALPEQASGNTAMPRMQKTHLLGRAFSRT